MIQLALVVIVASHHCKSHVSPHFDHCDLMNAMEPLTSRHLPDMQTHQDMSRYILTLS